MKEVYYLRHHVHAGMNRISYLVRKSSSFARNPEWLYRRVLLVLFTRNERINAKLANLANKHTATS